jgi:predicted nuclease of predicted toxin-antitoxin system
VTLRLLVDMNLPPAWVQVLEANSWPAVHWSAVGDPRATDKAVMEWARTNGHVVFTHDLDFSTLLALTHSSGPSVLQIRAEDVLPENLKNVVFAALRDHERDLAAGAIVVVDESRARVRVLPI